MIQFKEVLASKDCHMTSLHDHNGFRALPETFWMKNLKKTRETMLTYLSNLMEDTTDFSWQGAKASHALLLCEMERGLYPGIILAELTK